MPRGIIIFGPSGAGKTTLGKIVAQRLAYPYFDIDDYIWKKDTVIPYTVMYTRSEKAGRLMEAISQHEYFVMAGSMDSFHAPFDPLFDLAVYLTADAEVRLSRIQKRELAMFGSRVLEGGDMYEENQRYLKECGTYKKDDYPTRRQHVEWAASLPCKVLYLNGEVDLAENAQTIIMEYSALKKNYNLSET